MSGEKAEGASKKCIVDELQARWVDVERHMEDCHPMDVVLLEIASGASSGDPSLMMDMARRVSTSLIRKEDLNPIEIFWLATVLLRLEDAKKAAKELSGDQNRGAPKNGAKSLQIASTVVSAVMDNGATSLEEAWAMTAEAWSVDTRTVRKYWSEWKPVFNQRKIKDEKQGDMVELSEGLKRMMRNNRGLKSPN